MSQSRLKRGTNPANGGERSAEEESRRSHRDHADSDGIREMPPDWNLAADHASLPEEGLGAAPIPEGPRQGLARHGRQCEAQTGSAWRGRDRQDGLGGGRCGKAMQARLGTTCRYQAKSGGVRLGMAGTVWPGSVGRGKVRQARIGRDWRDQARTCRARQARHHQATLGTDGLARAWLGRRGLAARGAARCGMAGKACSGLARFGWARRGQASMGARSESGLALCHFTSSGQS